MKINSLGVIVGSLSLISLVFAIGSSVNVSRRAKHVGQRTPVLVELFTSEGCSSCPPADLLLQKLVREQAVDGAQIIALSEHVDYWDTARWRDRFSSPQFSARQSVYARSLHDGPYTPQMVIDGQKSFVGSDDSAASSAIALASARTKIPVSLELSQTRSNFVNGKVTVSKLPRGSAQIFAAITEDRLSNQVMGGENEGRHLEHWSVVRRIQQLPRLGNEPTYSGVLSIPIDNSWKRKDLSVVVFAQSRNTGSILGATSSKLKL